MQHPLAARRQAKPNGVIEVLTAGYAAVTRHLWVLLLPILLDLLLWLGPHVSFSPLVDPTVTRASELVARQTTSGPRRAAVQDPEIATFVDQARQFVIARTAELNVLSLVAHGPIAVPTVGAQATDGSDFTFVNDWTIGTGLLGVVLLTGLLVGGCFYSGVAAASTGSRIRPLRIGRQVARVLGLIVTLIGVSVLLGVPVLMLVAFTWVIAPVVSQLGLVLVVAAIVFAALHLSFALDAIFVSDVGPLAAIQRSVGVVRRNLLPSVGLILLTWLILAGMSRVWDLVAGNVQPPIGIALSILGNAYIASGLIAASMIFYTERVELPSAATASNAPSPS